MATTTFTPGNTLSGKPYFSEKEEPPNQYCWMELSVYDIPASHRSRYEAAKGALFATTFNAAVESGAISPLQTFIVVFELYTSESPRTVDNFVRLCTNNPKRQHQTIVFEDAPLDLTYKGTFFHKIIPGFMAQGGDLTHRIGGGCNLFSAFGKTQFPDENMKRYHDEPGLLAMANNGPNTNGSQFFITTGTKKQLALDGRHCCFGKVISGLEDFLKAVAPQGDLNGWPKKHIVITDCGAGTP